MLHDICFRNISVVIPAHNSGQHLQLCLAALFAGDELPFEVIVVDDGSSDNTKEVAGAYPVRLCSTDGRRGPAFARNLGAKAASSDVLLFLDSDVCVHPGTLVKISDALIRNPGWDALIGSYDDFPRCTEFLSQYRNLLHAYVHQSGAERASTFWSGCGAIRRKLFLEHSGFQELYGRPAIEDIELGYRLIRAGCKITLDRDIQVTHLKRWTFWGLVKTDIFDRGIPWTELIWRERFMPNDLNLHLSQRVSVALVFILAALSCAAALLQGAYFLIPLFTVLFSLLARWWIEFAMPQRPRGASIVLVSTIGLIVVLASRHGMGGIIPPLILGPFLLLIRHFYAVKRKQRHFIRISAAVYSVCSLAAAALYFPSNKLMLVSFGILAVLGILNSQFYLFLAETRGVPFLLAAIPFHFLYHFYNGVSFAVGTIRYSWSNVLAKWRSITEPGSNEA